MKVIPRILASIALALTLLVTPAYAQNGQPTAPAVSAPVMRQTITLPIVVKGPHIFVVAQVGPDRRKALLLIDSGASQTVLNMKYVPTHKGQVPGDIHIISVAGVGQVPSLPTAIHVEGYDTNSGSLDVTPDVLYLNQDFGMAQGLLGCDVLSQFDRVTFDLKAGVLILEKGTVGSK